MLEVINILDFSSMFVHGKENEKTQPTSMFFSRKKCWASLRNKE